MASKKIPSLLKSVSDRLQPVLGFDRFYGVVYDPVRSLVEFPWVMQDGKPVKCGARPYQPTVWLLDSIIHAKSSRLMEQDFEQELNKASLKYWSEGDLPQSWLAVPMLAEDRAIGVLVVESQRKSKAFGENGVRVLTTIARQTAQAIENARLADRLNTLYKMGPQLNSKIRLGELGISQLIYQQASELMDTSNLYVALYDESTDMVRFPLIFVDGQPTQVSSRSGGRGRTEWIIQNREPILNDTRAESEAWYKVPGREEYIGEPFASWVGVPMMAGDKALGVIATYHKTLDYVYTKDDQEVLSLMANQAAVAIENARLYSNLEKRNEQLAALQEIGVEITSQLELDKALGSIVEHANELLSADFSTLFLYNVERGEFGKGIRKGKVTLEPSIPSNTGYSGRIAQDQRAVFFEYAESEPNVKPIFLENKKVKSFAGVPLVSKGKTVGLLYVNYLDRHDFSNEEKAVIGLLSNQAAVAIENATLVARLRSAQDIIVDRERDLVMSSMAMDFVHKMNNLAGPIGPWIVLIKREMELAGQQNSKILEYLDNIYGGAALMLKEAHEFRYPSNIPEQIDLEELVGSIVGQLELMTSAVIEFNSESELPAICAIKYQISAAVYSVVSNAVKAVSDHGNISVKLGRNGDKKGFVRLDVSDTGCGISTDRLESIFDLGTSYWSDGQGTGYGLWRTRNIVRGIGGSISVTKSVLGEGSTFTILLPFA